jgi:hypothetical protein
VIIYLWEAVRDTPEPRCTLGVSDDERRARDAAEDGLRDGQVGLARVELARLATNARSLTRDYVRTGLGWMATSDPVGGVTWIRDSNLAAANELCAVAGPAGRETRGDCQAKPGEQ